MIPKDVEEENSPERKIDLRLMKKIKHIFQNRMIKKLEANKNMAAERDISSDEYFPGIVATDATMGNGKKQNAYTIVLQIL